jgi:asparagine synthase (glutamine-hydrolysing)
VESLASATFASCGRSARTLARTPTLLAVVEGHFYNAEELGSPKESRDATEADVFLDLYRRHGCEGALALINGDFAVALYDSQADALWLGRDRVGQRPLYYAETPSGIAFASQPGALLALPDVPTDVNRRFVAVCAGSHYRYFDNDPEQSPYAAIRQVPAATVLEFRKGTGRSRRYWQLSDQPEIPATEQELAATYRHLLMDAVRRRLRVGVNPAFTLSGGMDSSSVMSCAIEAAGRKLDAFSSVYADKTFDESEDIHSFLEHNVRQWHPIRVEGFDLFPTVQRMVAAHDEPVATATWLSHFLLCEEVRRSGFDALFGGLGGDELNAGEYEYFIFHFADLARDGQQAELAHEIECWAQHHDHPIHRKSRDVAEEVIRRLTDPAKPGVVIPDQRRMARYYPAISEDYYPLTAFQPVLDHPFSSWLKNRTYQDIFRETAPCCLRAEDRNCVAADLDHADPFFDHRLIEFMFRVPGRLKIRDGITKRLLRQAMAGILPEETRLRIKKTGWNAPAHLWFSRDALTQLQDLIGSQRFRERGLYKVGEVHRLLAEHMAIVESNAVKENHMMFFWQLVNVELWLQHVDELGSRRLGGDLMRERAPAM